MSVGERGVSEQYRKASEVVAALFSGLEQESLNRSNNLVRGWKETVGAKIAAHSKVIDISKGNLIVEVDHPGWSQQIVLDKRRIVQTISRMFPDLEFRNIVIRVVSECKEPYRPEPVVVGEGIPRSGSEKGPEAGDGTEGADVAIREDMDDELKAVLCRLKDSLRNGKKDR